MVVAPERTVWSTTSATVLPHSRSSCLMTISIGRLRLSGGPAQDAAVDDQIPRRVLRGRDGADEDGVLAKMSSDDVGNDRDRRGQLATHRVGEQVGIAADA